MDLPKLAKDIMVTKLVTLSPDGDVLKAMVLLLKNRISGTPVIDDKRNFVGVFSEKCCMSMLTMAVRLASEGDAAHKPEVANKLSKDVMVTRLVTLSPDRDVFEAIGYLLKHRISGAPVIDHRRNFLGIFSERYCMSVLIESAAEQLPTAKVAAFMNTDFGRTIPEATDLLRITQIFLNTHYRRLPVLRDGKLVGQISRRDVLRAVHKWTTVVKEREAALCCLRERKRPSDVPVEDGDVPVEDRGEPSLTVHAFMDADAQTITEDTDLLSIAQIFLNTNYRRLPVLRAGKLVGQVSRRDLLRAAHALLAVPRVHERSLLYLSSLMERHEAPIE